MINFNNLFKNNTSVLADITSYLDQYDTSCLISLESLFGEMLLNVINPTDVTMYLYTSIFSLVYYLGFICFFIITFVGKTLNPFLISDTLNLIMMGLGLIIFIISK